MVKQRTGLLPRVRIGNLEVTRLIVGGNPFSGISHQTDTRDWEMRDYYTAARIKAVWKECERRGINACIARMDNHMMRLRREYVNEGGKLLWIGQTAPEIASIENNIRAAKVFGASAVFIQGGVVDRHFREGKAEELRKPLALIRELGMVPGIASHDPDNHRRARDMKLDVDFHAVCFYRVEGRKGVIYGPNDPDERFVSEDRDKAAVLLRELERPCIAYKILAAGRNDPAEAFRFAFAHAKPTDAVAVGMFVKDKKDMVAEDVRLALEAMKSLSENPSECTRQ
ncbi:MAG: hypothetical protein N3A38_02860 [Planctomycetota bacterium]|nr:hypothetical protein [Planctomycetota bacterium]